MARDRNEKARAAFKAAAERSPQLRPRDWYVIELGADQVARRHEIFGLLGWYHRSWIQPQLGFRGAFRRLWWQLTGQGHKLLSPWDLLERKAAEIAAANQLQEEMAARASAAELAAVEEQGAAPEGGRIIQP